jgi:hypothetical protein
VTGEEAGKFCAAPPRGGTSRRFTPRVPSPVRGSVTRGYGSKAPSGLPETTSAAVGNGRVAPLECAALQALIGIEAGSVATAGIGLKSIPNGSKKKVGGSRKPHRRGRLA